MSAENQCKQDAFQLLMASSKDETKLPKAYENPKSNDLKLYNDILGWLKSLKIGWSNDLMQTLSAKVSLLPFVILYGTLTAIGKPCLIKVWHIKEDFPEGYNVPHSWKGMKRVAGNLDINNLESLLNTLFEQTCTSFMRKINWEPLRVIILQLTDALRKYMEYRNTKKMKDTENKTETLSSNLHQASSKFYAEFLSATKTNQLLNLAIKLSMTPF